MKAYGVKRKDAGCCPGHDKYPATRYRITTTTAHRARVRHAKKSARAAARRDLALRVREG